MLSLNSVNSVTNIFVITVRGLKPVTQPPLVYETRMLQQRQQIFKLSSFPEFAEFSESLFHLEKTPILMKPASKLRKLDRVECPKCFCVDPPLAYTKWHAQSLLNKLVRIVILVVATYLVS